MLSTMPDGSDACDLRPPSLRVCLVSTASASAAGGLSAYMRCLSQGLSASCGVSGVARFETNLQAGTRYDVAESPRVLDNGTLRTQIIAPAPAYRPLLTRLHHLTSRKGLRRVAIKSFVGAYQPALRRAIPDYTNIIHYVSTGWELLGFAALAEARRRNIPFTVLPAVHPDSWGDGELDIRLYDSADAVFTLSDYEREHLAGRGVARHRLHTTGLAPASEANGNGQRFRTQHKLGTRPLVLFIGRKEKSKGFHALRQAMNNVLCAVPDACLVSIGPERQPPYPDLPPFALLDLGQADEQTKADALAACDVFCMPSEAESFGLVYVEAWSYGKPVVGGTAPAVREMIAEGVNGYTVTQDAPQIAAILIRLLSDPALRQRLGAAGQELQRTRYNWNDVTAFHKQIFEQIYAKYA